MELSMDTVLVILWVTTAITVIVVYEVSRHRANKHRDELKSDISRYIARDESSKRLKKLEDAFQPFKELQDRVASDRKHAESAVEDLHEEVKGHASRLLDRIEALEKDVAKRAKDIYHHVQDVSDFLESEIRKSGKPAQSDPVNKGDATRVNTTKLKKRRERHD